MGRFSRTETITHDLGEHGRLSLRTANGDVQVRTVDGSIATVHASYDVPSRHGQADIPPDASPIIVRKGRFELEVETRDRVGGFLDAIGDVISGGARTTVEFEVDLPRGAALRLHGVSADLTVEGVRGTQEYHTVSGDVSVRDTGGDISIHSVSGDVSIVDAGVVEIGGNTTSGDLQVLARRIERFGFSSVSGDIDLEGELAPGDHQVETVTGDLQLTTVSGLEVEASGPAVSVRVDMPHRSESGRGRKSIVVGDGSARVRFRSMSGDVTVSPPYGPRSAGAAISRGIDSLADRVVRGAELAGRRAEAMARQFEAVGRRMETMGRDFGVEETFTASTSDDEPDPAVGTWTPPADRGAEQGETELIDQMAVLRALERGEIDVAEASRLLSEAGRDG